MDMSTVIVTAGDFPYGHAAEALVRNLALGIHENGEIVEVVRLRGRRFDFHNDTPVKCSNFLFKKPFKNEGLKLIELAAIISWIPFFVACRRFFKKDRAIILYSIEYAYQIVPFIIWSLLFRVKCYRFIGDSYDRSTIMPVWWKAPKLLFSNMQYRFIDRHLSGVIVLTRYLYERCIEAGVDKKRLLLIPHFIKMNNNVSYSLDNEKVVIGFCGSPLIRNGIIDLLEAFQQVVLSYPNSSLLIIGKVGNEVKNYLKHINYDERRIIFTGYLSNTEIANYLKEVSILVNPRQSGLVAEAGFPTKLGEYFAARKPVVATKVGDLKTYFIDKEQLVFAEPNNPQSLASAIIYLIQNPKEAERIAENGYTWASNNLDYKTNAGKLLRFISQT